MSGPGVIEAIGLCRDYGRRRALGPIDLSITGGRVVALIGPNGAGKSTLLRLIRGLIAPTGGTVQLLGHPSRQLGAATERLVAWVGDGHEPPAWAKLRWMMRLQAQASPAFVTARAESLLAERGLDPQRRYGQLSKGQKRWALTTLALASQPDLLIFDEPADGLDPAARARLYQLVREDVSARGSTALIASHILADIERVADEVIVMHHGLIRLHEELETLREQVREIEAPDDVWIAHPISGVDEIVRWHNGDTQRLLVRSRNGALTSVTQQLGPDAVVRTVDLDTLYAGLTQPATDNANDGE